MQACEYLLSFEGMFFVPKFLYLLPRKHVEVSPSGVHLMLANISAGDAGRYTCRDMLNAQTSHFELHVHSTF